LWVGANSQRGEEQARRGGKGPSWEEGRGRGATIEKSHEISKTGKSMVRSLNGKFRGGSGITKIEKSNGISRTGRSTVGESIKVIKEMGISKIGKSLTGVTEKEIPQMGMSQTGTENDGETVVGGVIERAWARALIS
jgi:hypothetical protein